jgi:hypothetical protein
MRVPLIIVQREAFDCGFDVIVLFASRDEHKNLDREFRSLRQARGYAAGLAATTGYEVRDCTADDTDDTAAEFAAYEAQSADRRAYATVIKSNKQENQI